MSGRMTVKLLLAMLVLGTSAQNECSDYSVTVTQDYFLVEEDVNLTCSYTNDPAFTTLIWETNNNTSEFPRLAYTYSKDFPQLIGPEPEFKDRLEGSFESNVHTLTILKANYTDGLTYWRCAVKTRSCTNGNPKSLKLTLTDMYFRNLTKLGNGTFVDSVNTTLGTSSQSMFDENAIGQNVAITCFALSDPQSSVSMVVEKNGREKEINLNHTCKRVDGHLPPPWNCSVTMVLSEGAVSCGATFNGITYETELTNIAPIITGLSAGAIAAIVVSAVAASVIILLCIVNSLCGLPCPKGCTNKICIPQMCTETCCPKNNNIKQ